MYNRLLSKPIMLFCSSDRSTGSRNNHFHRRSLFSLKITVSATLRGRTSRLKHVLTDQANKKSNIFTFNFPPFFCRYQLSLKMDGRNMKMTRSHAGNLWTTILNIPSSGCDDKLALTDSLDWDILITEPHLLKHVFYWNGAGFKNSLISFL